MATYTKKSFSKESRRGQSLIEAIVALSILTVGFLGIMTLLTKSFQLNRTTGDETKATYLAAEGIEVTKSLIDHSLYLGIASGGNLASWSSCPGYADGYYKIDYQSVDCSLVASTVSLATTTYPLYFNPLTGLYSDTPSGSSIQTIFSRSVRIAFNSANAEITVESTVYWSPSPGDPQSITLQDNFYNWDPANL
jgi:hypothetical protein